MNPKALRLLLLLLLALFLVLGVALYSFGSDLLAVRRQIHTLEEEAVGLTLSPRDLSRLAYDLSQLRGGLEDLKGDPIFRLLPYLGWLPRVGEDLKAAPLLVDVALSLTRAGEDLLAGLRPLAQASTTFAFLSSEGTDVRLLAALEEGQPHWRQALSSLEAASRGRARLSQMSLSPRLAGYLADLDLLLGVLQKGARAAAQAPELARYVLGFDAPRDYLLLAQNSYEIRATGGFISGAWLLSLDQGRLTRLVFYNSPDVDDPTKKYPPPPEALFKYMYAGQWLFRDANWFPHFPTSAALASQFYEMGQGEAVDGVIGIDEHGVEAIIEALGPVELKGLGEVIDQVNINKKLQSGLTPLEGEDLPERKFMLKVLFQALVERVQEGLSPGEAVSLTRALLRSLEERHLLIYIPRSPWQSLLRDNRWDGSLLAESGDYLQVVDSNVGYNKVGSNIKQVVEYEVFLNEARPRSVVRVRYRNQSKEDTAGCQQQVTRGSYAEWLEGCFWNYLRVYVPGGSTLDKASYIPLPRGSLLVRLGQREDPNLPSVGPGEEGREVFGLFFVIAPQEEKEVFFSYFLPQGIVSPVAEGRRYRLLIQKQAGTEASPVAVTINLPPGATVLGTWPRPHSIRGSRAVFQDTLRSDREYEVLFAP